MSEETIGEPEPPSSTHAETTPHYRQFKIAELEAVKAKVNAKNHGKFLRTIGRIVITIFTLGVAVGGVLGFILGAAL